VDRALTRVYGCREQAAAIQHADRSDVARHGTVLDGLVRTILSQNTTDANSHRAFESLVLRFPRWEDVAVAPVADLEDAIRSGGLARLKAARIQAILSQIRQERGDFSLDFLADMPDEAAWHYLARFKGVGPKTAACVLLFDLGRHVFPVDTHILRVAKRIGWLEPGCNAERAHEVLGKLIPGKLHYRMHVNLIAHGRDTCRPARPRCAACPIAGVCRRIGVEAVQT